MASRTRVLYASFVLVAFAPIGLAQTITEFPVVDFGSPFRITTGPDGALWYTTRAAMIGRITTAGVATYFPFPVVAQITDITTGLDGNLWYTFADTDEAFPYSSVGRITPAGVVTSFQVTGDFEPSSEPYGITAGQDGALWFTERLGNKIGRLTTAGVLTKFPLPTASSSPTDIARGSDGALWFTETGGNRIGRITTDGVITEFPISSPATGIARGADFNMWFTQRSENRIGRITPEGDVTEFPLPTAGSGPVDIVGGNDGALWFTESDANRIGRITIGGLITEYPVPTSASSPEGITLGPDGNIWFTETAADKIGRITLTQAPAIDSRVLPVVGSTAGVGGSFFRTSVQLHNPTSGTIAGRIVFHPSGISGSDSDPALAYTLSPGQTGSIADLLPAMGRSGLGSADVEATSGSVPTVTARVFNDAGASGTTGFTEEPVRVEDALRPGGSGVLVLPADLTSFRYNLGVRTLEAGATATLTLRDASGTVVTTLSRTFSATYHEQQSTSAFLGVMTLPPGGSISIAVGAGGAIFYGATVDNITGDPSFQVARAAP
jgi:virginiamycin B lyase